MKYKFSAALMASMFCSATLLVSPTNAAASAVAFSECGFVEEAPIFGVGMAASTEAKALMIPLELGIVQRGDQSAKLRSIPVPATNIADWTADYAMMRLSHNAGRPIWALTENGQPGSNVSVEIPATNLADAFDRVAGANGMRWRYDGDKVYLLGGREWTMMMPSNRDLAIAVRDAMRKNNVEARIEGSVLRFQADEAGVGKVTSIVNQIYSQQRLNPYDVKFYKVFPARGEIDWANLVERTDAVETVSFEGKGATIVLDPTAGAVIDAFLAREGQVHSLGSTTMVSAQMNYGTSHAAGCGPNADGNRGIELAGGAYERGRVSLSYSILGGSYEQSGKLAVTPGAIVVIADAIPDQGGYMVAVVRPRVLELQNGAPGPV